MVVVMEERASEDQIQHVVTQLTEKGFDVHRSTGQLRSFRHEAHRSDGWGTRGAKDH